MEDGTSQGYRHGGVGSERYNDRQAQGRQQGESRIRSRSRPVDDHRVSKFVGGWFVSSDRRGVTVSQEDLR